MFETSTADRSISRQRRPDPITETPPIPPNAIAHGAYRHDCRKSDTHALFQSAPRNIRPCARALHARPRPVSVPEPGPICQSSSSSRCQSVIAICLRFRSVPCCPRNRIAALTREVTPRTMHTSKGRHDLQRTERAMTSAQHMTSHPMLEKASADGAMYGAPRTVRILWSGEAHRVPTTSAISGVDAGRGSCVDCASPGEEGSQSSARFPARTELRSCIPGREMPRRR